MQAAPLRALIALVLALFTLVSSGSAAQAAPGLRRGGSAVSSAAQVAPSRLQEVPPPPAVVAIAEQLADHQPQVEIVAPADDALIPDGPWTLQLRVNDWPLAGSETLGLGPHLVVQLDQQPPLRITSPAEAAAVTLPALQPGSHRLTVYAARPWGEAVKSPGAVRQIRVHRVSRNAAELPARGSAQLLVSSPAEPAQQEPVLLDWLLLDAPLQHLRSDDARWRLRVSVNGDSVLVDRQTPLWLKGFRPGSNAVQLELLDARGDALNPPFNSLVREVVIGSGTRAAWRSPNLSASELALLSGRPSEPQPEAVDAASGPSSSPTPDPEPASKPEPNPETEPEPAAEPAPEPEAKPVAEPEPQHNATPEPAPTAEPGPGAAPVPVPAPAPSAAVEAEAAAEATPPAAVEAPATSPEDPAGPAADTSQPEPEPTPEPAPAEAARPAPPSARDQVNADGSLVQPRPRGPLAGLREKLGG